MNVYQRLNEARSLFHRTKLQKTGYNKFAGYYYFELSDFVVPALDIFNKCGLLSVIKFGKEIAEMHIINVDKPEEVIIVTSPMSEAALKGCHPVQNLGAVETYIRRYLWVSALEVVEHDALDATTGKKGDGPTVRPTQGAEVSDERMSVIADVREAIIDRMSQDDIIGAYEEYLGITDPEEKTALWGMLDSKIRSAIKKHGESLKGKSNE
jgi:hypothetical protein